MAQCKKCKAEIVWVETPAGKLMPCDPGEVFAQTAVTPGGEVFKAESGGKVWGLVPHWATCPNADEFRKPKVKADQVEMFNVNDPDETD